MAYRDTKQTSVLTFLSKGVGDNVYSKLKAFNDVEAKESPLWITFVRFRQHGDAALGLELPMGWEGSKEELLQATILYVIRLRRNWEPWKGQELHDLIGEIQWGLSSGAGEDLLDFVEQAKDMAADDNHIGTWLQLLGLERMIVVTYSDSGENRVRHLKSIFKERGRLLAICRTGNQLEPAKRLKRNRKLRHVKPDLLFRLSKAVTDKESELLRAYMMLHNKNAKQVRLLEYYRSLDLWNKQQEQEDWRGERLPQLKNRTLLWLMRKMCMLGGWQGSQLHEFIGDIRWCILKGIDPEEIGLFEMSERLAKEEESYELQVALFELRKVAKEKFSGESISFLAFGAGNVLTRLDEIEEVQDFRIEHFEQIKAKNAISGINHIEGWKRFDAILNRYLSGHFQSGEALREYFTLRMMAAISLERYPLAIEMCQSLITLHNDRPHLKGANWKRYFKELRAIVFAFALGGDFDRAQETIELMERLGNKSPNLLIQSIMLRLLATDHLFSVSGKLDLARKAMESYQANKHLLSYSNEVRHWIWLHFLIAKVALHLSRYDDAVEMLNNILDQKNKSSKQVLGHSRVMLLIARLGQEMEIEAVHHAAIACSMFLHRHKNLPKLLHDLTLAIKKIASFHYHTDQQFRAIKDSIRVAAESSANETIAQNQAIEFRYADALEVLFYSLKDRQQSK